MSSEIGYGKFLEGPYDRKPPVEARTQEDFIERRDMSEDDPQTLFTEWVESFIVNSRAIPNFSREWIYNGFFGYDQDNSMDEGMEKSAAIQELGEETKKLFRFNPSRVAAVALLSSMWGVNADLSLKLKKSYFEGASPQEFSQKLEGDLDSAETKLKKVLPGGLAEKETGGDILSESEDAKSTMKKIESLRVDLGDKEIERWEQLELRSVKSQEEREKELENLTPAWAEGFDRIGIPNQTVMKIVSDTLPKAFLNRRLGASIRYEDELHFMDPAYGLGNSKEAACTYFFPREIVFSKGSEKDPAKFILGQNLIYEVGHLMDFGANPLLTFKERTDLLYAVVNRVKSENRYKSDFVESINNSDKQLELQIKATEYWSVIFSAYLTEDYDKLPPADRDLVENLIKKMDPDFNRQGALNLREVMMMNNGKK